MFYMADKSGTAIVRLCHFKESIKDAVNESKRLNQILCMTVITEEELEMMRSADCVNLHCIMVNQYGIVIGYPFNVPIHKSMTRDQARDVIVTKLNQINVNFRYGYNEKGEAIMREVGYAEKLNFIMYYIDFKTSRR